MFVLRPVPVARGPFRRRYLRANDRFNDHDFADAFGDLPETAEWHPMKEWGVLGADTFTGRTAIIAAYDELLQEFPDWRVDPEEFIEAADGVILVLARSRVSGRASGARAEQRFTQAWEFDAHGAVQRVREYSNHQEALAAYSK